MDEIVTTKQQEAGNMNSRTIVLELTEEQAISALTAVHGQRSALERLRQDMITNLSPQSSIQTIAQESRLLAEVEKIIKEAL